jgi:ribosomal protein S18 acetylase RimI-like enzyme
MNFSKGIVKLNQMNINIRKSTEDDFPEILSLIKELASFENAAYKVENTVEQMVQEKDSFKCFIAESDTQEVVGIALYYFAYYTWVGKSLYLDDLYVKKEYRGNKIGKKLLDCIFKIAKDENCKRVRWQVLDWNEPAIAFYKKIGAKLDPEWYNCDFNRKAIQEFSI